MGEKANLGWFFAITGVTCSLLIGFSKALKNPGIWCEYKEFGKMDVRKWGYGFYYPSKTVYEKNYELNPKEYRDIVQFGEDRCKISTFNINKTSGSYRIVEIKGLAVASNSLIFDPSNRTIRAPFRLCGHQSQAGDYYFNETVNFSYIVVSHTVGATYGHWLHEVMSRLIVMPRELLKNARVLLPPLPEWAMAHVSMLDYADKIDILPVNAFQTPKSVLYFDSLTCTYSDPYMVQRTREWFIKEFRLDTKKPFRYVIYQRRVSHRRISNYDALFEAIQKEFPDINWEKSNEPKGVNESAQYWNEIKFILTVHGGQMSNIIFMQPNTTVIEIMDDRCFECFYASGVYNKLRYFQVQDRRFGWSTTSIPLNISETIETIRRALTYKH